MEIPTGNNIYEVVLTRLVTTTENLSIFVRADNEDSAVEQAIAKAEFGEGHITNSRTDAEICGDPIYVQFVSKVEHATEHA